MREIPSLSVLCLRAIGSSRCSAEDTFAPLNASGPAVTTDGTDNNNNNNKTSSSMSPINKETTTSIDTSPATTATAVSAAIPTTTTTAEASSSPIAKSTSISSSSSSKSPTKPPRILKLSTASRLLRSFHSREIMANNNSKTSSSSLSSSSFSNIPLQRTPAIGSGSARREQANDVDLYHPWIAVYQKLDDEGNNTDDEITTTVDDYDNVTTNNKLPNVPNHITDNLQLVAEYGSTAIDVLQSYIDSLVELGRMDDTRLGLHFFQEYKANIALQHGGRVQEKSAIGQEDHVDKPGEDIAANPTPSSSAAAAAVENDVPFMGTDVVDSTNAMTTTPTASRGRKRGRRSPFTVKKRAKLSSSPTITASPLPPLPTTVGSLSLHNAIMLDETLDALLQSNVLQHIAVLDLTGLSTLTDDMLHEILNGTSTTAHVGTSTTTATTTTAALTSSTSSTHQSGGVGCGRQLKRLSLKNCRRLTDKAVQYLTMYCPNLHSLDVGGAYNITPTFLLEALLPLQTKQTTATTTTTTTGLTKLQELHASGLGWTNDMLQTLFGIRTWHALSVGFSSLLTFSGWKDAIWADSTESMCNRIQSLAVPFCEYLVDNAWLGVMGRHMPHLRALDVRGNSSLNSMTGWYDGRATIVPSVPLQQSLIVLARYSGISKSSVEDTKRIHPAAALLLTVVLGSGGVGLGILRMERKQSVVIRSDDNAQVNADTQGNTSSSVRDTGESLATQSIPMDTQG